VTPRDEEWNSLGKRNSVLESQSSTSSTEGEKEKIKAEIEQNKKRINQLEDEFAQNPLRKIVESAQFQHYRALHERREAITNELNGRVASPTAEPTKVTLTSSLPLSPAPPKSTSKDKPVPSWTGPSFESFPSALMQPKNKEWLDDYLQKYNFVHSLGSNKDKMLLHNKEKNIDVAVNPNSIEFTCRGCSVDQLSNMVADLYVKTLEGKPRVDQHTVDAPDDLRDKVILKMAQKLQEEGLVDKNTKINDRSVQDILNNAPSQGPSVTVSPK
jgi:hypothetical protein